MQKELKNPPLYFWLFMGFTIGLFFYFGWCGFMGYQPFTHEKAVIQPNISCLNELQRHGYCCKSLEQYNSGNCTQ